MDGQTGGPSLSVILFQMNFVLKLYRGRGNLFNFVSKLVRGLHVRFCPLDDRTSQVLPTGRAGRTLVSLAPTIRTPVNDLPGEWNLHRFQAPVQLDDGFPLFTILSIVFGDVGVDLGDEPVDVVTQPSLGDACHGAPEDPVHLS